MGKKETDVPELFINRELSWLEFNDRVLREGLSEVVPLLERLKFLAIVSSNLDEFFMIRVAGLIQQRAAGVRKHDFSGLTPLQQLSKISHRVHQLVQEQTTGIKEVLEQLHHHGLHLVESEDWSPRQKRILQNYFNTEVQPVLTPISIQETTSSPLLPSLQLYVAILLTTEKAAESTPQIVVIPVPSQLPRFIQIPSDQDVNLALLEEVIAAHIHQMYPKHQVSATASFRITRDADVAIQDDEAGDLLSLIEKAVLDRRRRQAIRLEISFRPQKQIKKWLMNWLKLKVTDTYEIDGLLDATALMEIAFRPGFDTLKDPEWSPQIPHDLIGSEDLWHTIRDHDVMLFHPYESFDPVIQLMQDAAEDANVLAVKQTLYRTSGDSPIIKALEQAAANGKQVTVLVELKARFDESRNIIWARRLEDAGCLVIYGIAGYKTHSKATLIVRKEGNRIRRYVHLSTGNYNDKTAKLYSDIGLMTCDNGIATDVSSFFNLLTGYSEVVGWSELTIAPTDLRHRFLELIEREIQTSTPQQPGIIWAKVNSLQDKKIIQALYRASRKGVQIKLNVRGICCLRPGVKKYSKNIEVVSIIDRYLEHPRIFYFYNAGHEEVYLSSADWMTRNLDKRLEILFPIKDPKHRRRLIHYLETYFTDNAKSHRLLVDGSYEKVTNEKMRVRAQEYFYQAAKDTQKTSEQSNVRFQPLTRPKE